ncbi:MAG: N-acetylmuramoyl-L-alanine amidase [Nitrospiraceae bacterium]|nr:N-acetylmuramoyl-L-alanine amidase [Nitrospiraceae bacterium]
MLSIFLKIWQIRAKQSILRGVYQDNLRIISKNNYTVPSRIFFRLKKTFLFSIVLFGIILGQGNYLDIPFFSEKELITTANLITQNPVARNAEKPLEANLSEYTNFIDTKQTPISRIFGLGVKKIMIDPGHGGNDPGTIGRLGAKEKEITLDIAKRLKDRLKKHKNLIVIMTRENDTTMPLSKRVEMARTERADLFISVHLNYLPFKPINIIETYYFGPSSDIKTLKLAEQENAGSQFAISEFKQLIEKIGYTLKLEESRKLATSIQKSLYFNSKKNNSTIHNFGVKRAPFVVLVGVDVPSVLAEVSCLSNKEEEIQLNNEMHRDNIARYLEAGILEYLKKGELNYEAKR